MGGDEMKKTGLILIGFFVLVLFIGCAGKSRVADLTLMASKNITTLEGATKMGTFEGKDCKSAFTGQLPSQEEALDKACEAGGGNAMVDVVIYYKPAACIFDDHCWEVKGTVIKTKDLLEESKIMDENIKIVDSNYIKETLLSPNGYKYLAFKKKSFIEMDNDKKHYDLIIRIK